MFKSLVKPALIGGLIVFAWGLISWMVLPWHHSCFNAFHDEKAVASVIKDNAPTRGLYVLPYTLSYDENSPSDEMKESLHLIETGPFVFASVIPGGMGRMGVKAFIVSFLTQFLGALILVWMWSKTTAKTLKLKKKVYFGILFGVAVGLLGIVPMWNWVGFPLGWVAAHFVDLIVGWGLASFAMAKLSK